MSYIRTEEHKRRMAEIKKNQVMTDEWRRNMSRNHADVNGKKNPRYKGGKPKCTGCGKELSGYTNKTCQPCYWESRKGKNQYDWKDPYTYMGLHQWVRRKLGRPSLCEFCRTTKGRFHWANKSHLYKKELTDWIRLCTHCHAKYDKEYRDRPTTPPPPFRG